MEYKKRAVSPVIATILLVLLAVATVSIIAAVVIPFVKDSLSGSKECFDVLAQVSIDTENGFACYTPTNGIQVVRITIKRSQKETDVASFKVSVFGEGTSNSFDIKQGGSNVEIYGGGTTIKIPGPGEERTYVLTTSLENVESAEVYPVLENGKICDRSDNEELVEC